MYQTARLAQIIRHLDEQRSLHQIYKSTHLITFAARLTVRLFPLFSTLRPPNTDSWWQKHTRPIDCPNLVTPLSASWPIGAHLAPCRAVWPSVQPARAHQRAQRKLRNSPMAQRASHWQATGQLFNDEQPSKPASSQPLDGAPKATDATESDTRAASRRQLKSVQFDRHSTSIDGGPKFVWTHRHC